MQAQMQLCLKPECGLVMLWICRHMLDCLNTLLCSCCLIQPTGPTNVQSFLPESSSFLPVSFSLSQAIQTKCGSCTMHVLDRQRSQP